MILIRLAGGLGNQIFQLGSGLLLAERAGIRKIVLDDSALKNYKTKRKNELSLFFDFLKFDAEVVFDGNLFSRLRIPRIFPLKFSNYPFVTDKNFQTVLKNPNRFFMMLDGYFQKCLTQYDFDREIQLLQKFLLPAETIRKDGCVIHIRGGDFVKLGWSDVTPREYYVKAIEIMKNEYQQNKFFILTDDMGYSKKILNGLSVDYEFIGAGICEDFRLIGCFNYRILSSSTFALWANVLGANKNSLAIAPEYWSPNHKRKIIFSNEMRILHE